MKQMWFSNTSLRDFTDEKRAEKFKRLIRKLLLFGMVAQRSN